MSKWEEFEIKLLYDNKNKSIEELCKIITSKTLEAIRRKYGRLFGVESLDEKRESYYKNPNKCILCEKELEFKERNKKFCNNSCAAKYNNKLRKNNKYCIFCNNIIHRNSNYFCSHKCQQKYQYNNQIEDWKQGKFNDIIKQYKIPSVIRRYLFEKYDNKCARCGWNEINPFSNKIRLEIEHIDGNYKNNNEDNLILLCPNCHSLTKTYKALNKGNGREYRRKNFNT